MTWALIKEGALLALVIFGGRALVAFAKVKRGGR